MEIVKERSVVMKKSHFSNPVIVINGKVIPAEMVKSVEMKFKKVADPVLTIELNSAIQIGEFAATVVGVGPTKTGFSPELFTSKETPEETFSLNSYSFQTLETASLLRLDRARYLPHIGVNRLAVEKRLPTLRRDVVELETEFYSLAGIESEKQAIAELKGKEEVLFNNKDYEIIDIVAAPTGILDTAATKFKIKESFYVYMKNEEAKRESGD